MENQNATEIFNALKKIADEYLAPNYNGQTWFAVGDNSADYGKIYEIVNFREIDMETEINGVPCFLVVKLSHKEWGMYVGFWHETRQDIYRSVDDDGNWDAQIAVQNGRVKYMQSIECGTEVVLGEKWYVNSEFNADKYTRGGWKFHKTICTIVK